MAAKRAKRQFTDEFKAGAVRLVLEEGKTIAAAARDLDISASVLRIWVQRARADRGEAKAGLTTEERAEFATMRKELRVVRMERDILKKAVAFFAKESA
jgi:transposase